MSLDTAYKVGYRHYPVALDILSSDSNIHSSPRLHHYSHRHTYPQGSTTCFQRRRGAVQIAWGPYHSKCLTVTLRR